MSRRAVALFLAASLSVGAAACGWESGPPQQAFGGPEGSPTVTARRGTVVLDGCTLTAAQRGTLESPAAKKRLHDVVFLCFTLDTAGNGNPSDAPSRAAFADVVTQVRTMGYTVKAGVSLSGDTGASYDATATQGLLQSAAWANAVVATVWEVAQLADGVDLDLQTVPDVERGEVTQLVGRCANVIRPAKALELFVPPSVTVPSDLADGDSFDVAALGELVDRIRVLTLDYALNPESPLAGSPGPTTDPGWAVDAVMLASSESRAPVDVSVPLYGWDFYEDGTASLVTFSQAEQIASASGASVVRSLGGDLYFDYIDTQGNPHEVWFDDARATLLTLAAMSPSVLSPEVGVLFYGLGGEDPSVWSTLEEATQP